MAEQINLAAPVGKTTQLWQVETVYFRRGYRFNPDGTRALDPASSVLQTGLIGDNEQRVVHSWNGAPADALIVALNKAPLNVKSLNQRIIEKLIADGLVAGNAAGNPD